MAHILVIDDEEDIRLLLQRVLEGDGHEVEVACNGKDAMRRQREKPAEVIITDIVMPEQEGIETLIELRREFPNVKVIVMSGGGRYGSGSYLNMAQNPGAHRVFIKPLDLDEVLVAVRELDTPT